MDKYYVNNAMRATTQTSRVPVALGHASHCTDGFLHHATWPRLRQSERGNDCVDTLRFKLASFVQIHVSFQQHVFPPAQHGSDGRDQSGRYSSSGSARARTYQSSSRVALWKHSTVHTRMKKDVNSMNMAPVSIRPACRRMAGIARLPMADAPVRNFAALIHLTKG